MYDAQRDEVDLYLEIYRPHEIRRVGPPGGGCDEFLLRDPGNPTSFDTTIVIHSAGITICGQLHPGDSGVTAGGYDLPWFSGEKSPGYLAEKFLRQSYDPRIAREDVLRVEAGDPGAAKDLRDLADDLENLEPGEVADRVAEITGCSDDAPGWDWNPDDFGLLVAVQDAFVRLYPRLFYEESGRAAGPPGGGRVNESEVRASLGALLEGLGAPEGIPPKAFQALARLSNAMHGEVALAWVRLYAERSGGAYRFSDPLAAQGRVPVTVKDYFKRFWNEEQR